VTRAGRCGLAYAEPSYAASLTEFGTPRYLSRSGGWLIERSIARTGHRDLMGPYPLFSCVDWPSLADDVEEIDQAFVSLVIVTDPLGDADPSRLQQAFPLVHVLKPHLIRDLRAPAGPLHSHHRRHLRRALRNVDVEVCVHPVEHLDEWADLYAGLADRHNLSGIRAFSRDSFRRQLQVPGMFAVRAERAGRTVSMALWLSGDGVSYYHLGASSREGYDVGASYAVFAAALDHLREEGIGLVDLGGAPGDANHPDGLLRFKRGWANGERPTYLCGRVINRQIYATLAPGLRSGRSWFPAYRAADPDFATTPTGRARGAARR
jgi:hypothetical protein